MTWILNFHKTLGGGGVGDIMGVRRGGGGGDEKGFVLVYGKDQSMLKISGDRLLLLLLWHILWVDCHIGESCDDRVKFASSILRASCTYTHIILSDRDTEISAVMLISRGFMIIAQWSTLHLRVVIINPWIYAEITAQLIRKVIICHHCYIFLLWVLL